MSFLHETIVRFTHIDAAGIVFYPRYFEMLNAAVEDWFAAMGRDFRQLHLEDRIGTPTVALDCQFVSPSTLGDVLTVALDPQTIGNSSCRFNFAFRCDNALRMAGTATLVCIDLDTKTSRPWPDAIADAMHRNLASHGNHRMA